MEEKMFGVKLTITAGLTALGSFLGWKGIMALAWAILMLLDYLSGTAAACKEGKWSSCTARQGIWHKAGMIVVVIVAGIADLVMEIICRRIPIGLAWPEVLLPMVLAWYIITELGSILENAVKMGAPVPGWLVKLLAVSLSVLDQAGSALPGESGKNNG